MSRSLVFLLFLAQVAIAQVSPHGDIKIDCQACHSTDSWTMKKDASFKHGSVGFALTGQHQSLKCRSCHQDLIFKAMNSNCLSCHTDFHKNELGVNCLRCHTTQSWQVSDMVQKHEQTRFPLLGRHSTVDCQSCHSMAAKHQFQGTPTTCLGCHLRAFQLTKAPDHKAVGFSTDCRKCHEVNASQWGHGFDHNLTSFPLTGAHTGVACISCHQNEVLKPTPAQCVACHQNDFATSKNPNHVAAKFSSDCQTCHTTASWRGGTYDHNRTRFALTGAHRAEACSGCHGDNVFAGKLTECMSCHQSAFASALSPNHVSNGFPQQCQTCHTTTAWRPSGFNHSNTKFPLTGAHTRTSCQSCHVNGNYQLVDTDCYPCHQAQFQQVSNPNHMTGNFSHDCQPCHTTSVWRPSTFSHSNTRFPLTGAHTAAPCQSCHINGNYQIVYTDCYPCHQTQFQQVTNPNHVAGNFSHDCQPCHTTTAWRPSTFNHGNTIFPLTGAHQAVACSECHVNNRYQGLSTACYDCHTADFNNSVNPNHVAGNFPHECIQCHTTTAWRPATFDHNTTRFPLTGTHTAVLCQSCHVNGNYQLVYSDCYQCHQAQYERSTTLSHVTLLFSHDCAPCHTTSTWLPSTFNHDQQYFNIYSGKHRGKWTSCTACHPALGNYRDFTCLSCHQHNQLDMDRKHLNVRGYVYSSPACYSCHRGV